MCYVVKVILVQDVKKLGNKGDVVNASDGYVRNYLFPRKLAIEATSQNLQNLEAVKEKHNKQKELEKANAKADGDKLAESPLTITAKAGKGKLFGAITTMEIASVIEEQIGIKIDKRKIELAEPIKNLGEHKVKVKLHPEVHREINIMIKAAE